MGGFILNEAEKSRICHSDDEDYLPKNPQRTKPKFVIPDSVRQSVKRDLLGGFTPTEIHQNKGVTHFIIDKIILELEGDGIMFSHRNYDTLPPKKADEIMEVYNGLTKPRLSEIQRVTFCSQNVIKKVLLNQGITKYEKNIEVKESKEGLLVEKLKKILAEKKEKKAVKRYDDMPKRGCLYPLDGGGWCGDTLMHQKKYCRHHHGLCSRSGGAIKEQKILKEIQAKKKSDAEADLIIFKINKILGGEKTGF